MQLMISRFFIRKQDSEKEKATLFFRAASRSPKLDVLISSQMQVNVKDWLKATSSREDFYLHRLDNIGLHEKLSKIEFLIKEEMFAPDGFSKERVVFGITRIVNPAEAERITRVKAANEARKREVELARQEEEERKRLEIERKLQKKAAHERTIWFYLTRFCEEIESGERLNGTQRYSAGTVKAWKGFRSMYEAFDPHHKYNWDNIDRAFVSSFVKHLEDGGYMVKSINKYLVSFRCLVGNAFNDEVHANNKALRLFSKKPVEDHDKAIEIYLTAKELKAIFEMPLDGKKAEVRDIFLVGCYTCQRVSDYSDIRADSFMKTQGGNTVIRFVQKKTNTEVKVPILSHYLKRICETYNYQLPSVVDVVLNRYIKEILRDLSETVPSLAQMVPTKLTMKQRKLEEEGKLTVERNSKGEVMMPRWACVTSHTARRTGITLLYLTHKFSIMQLMHISGHKTQKTFLEYIKLSSDEIADDIAKVANEGMEGV